MGKPLLSRDYCSSGGALRGHLKQLQVCQTPRLSWLSQRKCHLRDARRSGESARDGRRRAPLRSGASSPVDEGRRVPRRRRSSRAVSPVVGLRPQGADEPQSWSKGVEQRGSTNTAQRASAQERIRNGDAVARGSRANRVVRSSTAPQAKPGTTMSRGRGKKRRCDARRYEGEDVSAPKREAERRCRAAGPHTDSGSRLRDEREKDERTTTSIGGWWWFGE